MNCEECMMWEKRSKTRMNTRHEEIKKSFERLRSIIREMEQVQLDYALYVQRLLK